MKTTHMGHLTSILLLPLFLFSVGCDSEADPVVGPDLEEEITPAEFTITSTLVPVTATRTQGTFEALGAIEDRGTVVDELGSTEPLSQRSSIYGIKTLASTKGSIKIEFYAGLSPAGPNMLRASGGFRIMEGTGAYENLEGGGRIRMEVASDASLDTIASVLTGRARWVGRS